jgi:hypothetical protein
MSDGINFLTRFLGSKELADQLCDGIRKGK